MAYVDTMLTPVTNYSYVHNGQTYDAIATALVANGNWQYIEYVDSISAPNTYRRHVWKCKATGSGLSADYYVVFETVFTTATGLYLLSTPVKVYLGETYTGQALGGFASTSASITPAANLTNPATFPLGTFAVPGSLYTNTYANQYGTSTAPTSMRFIFLVTNDAIIITRAGATGSTTPSTDYILYVGAYETIMSAGDDPLPIVLMGNSTSTSAANIGGAFTRCPQNTAGVAVTEVYAAASYNLASTTIAAYYPGRSALNTPTGTAGSPTTTTYWKNLGATASRCPVHTWLSVATNASTKGVFRGYLKNVVCANLAAHQYGDKFVVDGKNYVGIGYSAAQAPLINTEAV